MKSQEMQNALDIAMSETAEQLFFQELSEMHLEQVDEVFGNGDYLVRINILDPFSASLYFFYEQKFADQLVTEMLGEEINNAEQVIDGLKELTNTIAGKFMAIMVPDKEFKISMPELEQISDASKFPFDQILNYYFDETRIGIALQEE